MDVTIICGINTTDSTDSTVPAVTTDDKEPNFAHLSTISSASLSIAVILAVVVAALVTVLIAVFVLRQRKKSHTASNDLSHHPTTDTYSGARYSSPGIHFNNKDEDVSLDEKLEGEDVSAESHEEVEVPVNSLPVSTKSQAHNKPAATPNVDPTRYAQGAGANVASSQPPVAQWSQGRGQEWQSQPPSHSPETIYDSPD
jgi:hypothetical protein